MIEVDQVHRLGVEAPSIEVRTTPITCTGKESKAARLAEIRPSLVQAFFDGIADKPGKQKVTLTVLKQIEQWAIVRELLPRQITLGASQRAVTSHGPKPRSPLPRRTCVQTLPERSVVLAAYTGQRRGDLVRMCPTDLETVNGHLGINVVQEKTKKRLWVPILPQLATEMATWERLPGPFLRRQDGLPWNKDDLTDSIETARNKHPELAGLVLHGFRGHACVQLRRAGLSGVLIADMIGMSVPMIEKYADQEPNENKSRKKAYFQVVSY
jgi:integrase